MAQRWRNLAHGEGNLLLLLAAVTLFAALFRFPGLGYPHEEYFDEVYHAKTALQYLHGEPPTEWVHPPTSKLLIAVGVAAFGYEPWAKMTAGAGLVTSSRAGGRNHASTLPWPVLSHIFSKSGLFCCVSEGLSI